MLAKNLKIFSKKGQGGGLRSLIRNRPIHIIVVGIFFVALVAIGFLLRKNIQTSLASTFGWTQTDWSGGANTTATATHSNNQTGWNKFYSKDAGLTVSTPNQVTLTAVSSTWMQTATADFSAGAVSGTYVTTGSVKLLKPFGVTCAASTECSDGVSALTTAGFCNGGVCKNPWVSGSCTTTIGNILTVYKTDYGAPTNIAWKNANTSCTSPQCSGGVLVTSSTVDFSAYPAQQACQAIGGRLPTLAELACVYTNRTSYNTFGAFQSGAYWSATEYSATSAWLFGFYDGSQLSGYSKTAAYYVRCVRGQ